MDATRQQLLANPERYIIQAWDISQNKYLSRQAATIRPEDLARIDLSMVYLLPVED